MNNPMPRLPAPPRDLPRDAQSILELAARSMFDLFANASEGMLLVDREARVVWINDQYRRFLPALGFTREEDFVGHPVSSVVQNTQMHKVLETGKPILIGTTGLEEHHHQAIDDAARHVAVLQTGNTSLGVTLLARLVREAATRLGEDWDIEIVEAHHRMKVDAPSGTAKMLGEAAAAGRGIDLATRSERGRDGQTGARAKGAIGFASLRAGTIAGDHTVLFATDGERISLSHHAENRSIFARGAIRAAIWLLRQPAGRYTMDQVIGV